jgi:hypothetical protein
MSKTSNAIGQSMENATFKADSENEHDFGLDDAISLKSPSSDLSFHRERARCYKSRCAFSHCPFAAGQRKSVGDTMQGYNTCLHMRDQRLLPCQTWRFFIDPPNATNKYPSVPLSLPADNTAALEEEMRDLCLRSPSEGAAQSTSALSWLKGTLEADKCLTASHLDFFWITGKAGAGKSALMQWTASIQGPESIYFWVDTRSCRRYVLDDLMLPGSSDTTGSVRLQRLQLLLQRLQRHTRCLFSRGDQGRSISPVNWAWPTKIMEVRSNERDSMYGTATERLVPTMLGSLMASRTEHVASRLDAFHAMLGLPETRCEDIFAAVDFQIPRNLAARRYSLCTGEECGFGRVDNHISIGKRQAPSDVLCLHFCPVEACEKSRWQASHGPGWILRHFRQPTMVKQDLQRHQGSRVLRTHAWLAAIVEGTLVSKQADGLTDTVSLAHMTARQYLSARKGPGIWSDEKAPQRDLDFFGIEEHSGIVHPFLEDHDTLRNTVKSKSLLRTVHIFAKAGVILLDLASMHVMTNYAVSRGLSSTADDTWFFTMTDGNNKVSASTTLTSCECSLTEPRTNSRNPTGLRNPIHYYY